MEYPKIVYRGGVLSSNPADQRTVVDADAELAATQEGFERWHTKAAQKPGVSAPDAAASAAFAKADKRTPAAGKGKASQ